MKKHRKQIVQVGGQRFLVDVPVDEELYKADNHEEYQRVRSNTKHVSLQDKTLADTLTADIADIYEKQQLIINLRRALQDLTETERQLISFLYADLLTERETAAILKIAQQTVSKKKHKILKKLRNSLINWL